MQQIHHPKCQLHLVHHPYVYIGMPTKTPSTQSQWKDANQNTKYANIDLSCFVARQFLFQIYENVGVVFEGLQGCVRKKW